MAEFERHRWQCNNGLNCYNKKVRLDFREFFGVLPNRRSFSDLDGWSERKGNLCMLEWKREPWVYAEEKALDIMYTSMTKQGHTGICIAGDSEGMKVSHLAVYRNGRPGPWHTATMADLQGLICRWSEEAEEQTPAKRAAIQVRNMSNDELAEMSRLVTEELNSRRGRSFCAGSNW